MKPLAVYPNLSIKESVAVVFSSPALLNAKNGTLIDSFDEVIRFNDFRIKGFEEFTGAKTTIFATYEFTLMGWFPKNQRDAENHQLVQNLKALKNVPLINTSAPDYFHGVLPNAHFINFDFLKRLNEKVQHASSGLRIIELLIAAGIVPNLFGFEREYNGVVSHYWEKERRLKLIHEWESEKEIILNYESENLIKIY